MCVNIIMYIECYFQSGPTHALKTRRKEAGEIMVIGDRTNNLEGKAVPSELPRVHVSNPS